MLQNIQLQISGLIPMLIICFFSFRNHSIALRSTRIYQRLLAITMLCIVSDIVSVVGIIYAPQALSVVLCKLYLWLTMWTGYTTFYYLAHDVHQIHRNARLRRAATVVNLALSLVIPLLPISIYNQSGAIYSYGPAVTFTFAISAFFILGCIVLTFAFKSQINPHRRTAIRMWMLLETGGALLQYMDRRLLLVSYTMSIGIVILYATIENQEANLDKGTGTYSFLMLREYMRELYDYNEHRACVVVVDRNSQERDSGSGYILMMEMANFLNSISGNRVFRGYSNDFVMLYPDEQSARRALPEMERRFSKPWVNGHMVKPDIYMIPNTDMAHSAAELLMLYQYYVNYDSSPEAKVTIIDAESLRQVAKYRETLREITDALEANRIDVYLQPIYSIAEKRFVSAEALVRMRDSAGRLVMPNDFIPAAERSGLIERIGDRVFEKVCALIRDHDIKAMGIEYIEVNLSVVQCENDALAERYADMIRSYGIDPAAINLEITESGQMRKRNVLLTNMTRLKDFGCSFSLDDFGTGESNLNYIVAMPIEIVKLDRTMVLSYFNNERSRVMMEYVASMIKSMGMRIVAEGVEEAYQLEALIKLGVDYIQGYYFSRPIPTEQFLTFIRERQTA